MQSPLGRAWQETVRSYRLTWGTAARFVLGSAAAIGLIYQVLGKSAAMSEAWVILVTLLAVAGACFLPAFLWNLWLAPYRIMDERLDAISASQGGQDDSARAARDARSERAQREAQLSYKKQDAIRDMKTILGCIEAIEERNELPSHMRMTRTYDHTFSTLREKYSDWFPSSLSVRDMKPWAERVVATLEHNDYEIAEERIKRAFGAGAWSERKKKP